MAFSWIDSLKRFYLAKSKLFTAFHGLKSTWSWPILNLEFKNFQIYNHSSAIVILSTRNEISRDSRDTSLNQMIGPMHYFNSKCVYTRRGIWIWLNEFQCLKSWNDIINQNWIVCIVSLWPRILINCLFQKTARRSDPIAVVCLGGNRLCHIVVVRGWPCIILDIVGQWLCRLN